MSRNIPRVCVWRVTVIWHTPKRERRHYFVHAPNKRFAWWNARDGILADVGAERFIARDCVTVGLTRKESRQ
jgi:hypothetical protein